MTAPVFWARYETRLNASASPSRWLLLDVRLLDSFHAWDQKRDYLWSEGSVVQHAVRGRDFF
jgi:hypothetical protein